MVNNTPKKVYNKLLTMVKVSYYLTPDEIKVLESAFVEKPKQATKASTETK